MREMNPEPGYVHFEYSFGDEKEKRVICLGQFRTDSREFRQLLREIGEGLRLLNVPVDYIKRSYYIDHHRAEKAISTVATSEKLVEIIFLQLVDVYGLVTSP